MNIRMKHMLSTVADLVIEYQIDQDKKTVEIQADWFDSSLFDTFILRCLTQENIDVVRDDTKKLGWTPYPKYEMFLTMAGLRFKFETHKLVDTSRDDKHTIVLTLINHGK